MSSIAAAQATRGVPNFGPAVKAMVATQRNSVVPMPVLPLWRVPPITRARIASSSTAAQPHRGSAKEGPFENVIFANFSTSDVYQTEPRAIASTRQKEAPGVELHRCAAPPLLGHVRPRRESPCVEVEHSSRL